VGSPRRPGSSREPNAHSDTTPETHRAAEREVLVHPVVAGAGWPLALLVQDRRRRRRYRPQEQKPPGPRAPLRQATSNATQEPRIRRQGRARRTGGLDLRRHRLLDHMLEQLSAQPDSTSRFRAEGDLHIDFHHTPRIQATSSGGSLARDRDRAASTAMATRSSRGTRR